MRVEHRPTAHADLHSASTRVRSTRRRACQIQRRAHAVARAESHELFERFEGLEQRPVQAPQLVVPEMQQPHCNRTTRHRSVPAPDIGCERRKDRKKRKREFCKPEAAKTHSGGFSGRCCGVDSCRVNPGLQAHLRQDDGVGLMLLRERNPPALRFESCQRDLNIGKIKGCLTVVLKRRGTWRRLWERSRVKRGICSPRRSELLSTYEGMHRRSGASSS